MGNKLLILGIIYALGVFSGWRVEKAFVKEAELVQIENNSKAEFQKAEKLSALLNEYQNKVPKIITNIEHEITTLPADCNISDDGLRTLQEAAGY